MRKNMATHNIVPSQFHSHFGPYPPLAYIKSGDTVITKTVDAAGCDENYQQRTPVEGGNWQTGPFFIEEARPGDTLRIELKRITPNRALGVGNFMIDNTLFDNKSLPLPAYPQPAITDFVEDTIWWENNPGVCAWNVDVVRQTARLRTLTPHLGEFELRIQPMLGCFGVVEREGMYKDCWHAGRYGGNMDYHGFVAGVRVYLPVFLEGALFSLGDVHALQGHGELTKAGIEISAEVEFCCEVIKQKSISWPRGENTTHLFTVGSARPLEQALRHATTEMSLWLQDSYELNMKEVGLLLGYAVEYEFGNLVNPNQTVVCKLAKTFLPKQ
jgi:amidase